MTWEHFIRFHRLGIYLMEIGMHNEGNGSAAPLQFSKVLPCDVSNLKKILVCQELVYIIIVLI